MIAVHSSLTVRERRLFLEPVKEWTALYNSHEMESQTFDSQEGVVGTEKARWLYKNTTIRNIQKNKRHTLEDKTCH